MEDKPANIIAAFIVIFLIFSIVIARLCLDLSKPFFLITGALAALILAITAWMLLKRRYTRRQKLLESQFRSEGRELRLEYSFLRKVVGVPIKFRYSEIEEATDKFQTLIGKGSSASVFKGILSDGTCVAVKRIEGEEHGGKEFRSEVAAIGGVQHVNLLRLLGYCVVPGGPRFLVQEFISNGSLDSWIFQGRENGRPGSPRGPGGCLSWGLRYGVAVDVAKALSYLHHDCRSRILHLDVKPENILVDESYRGIVADFGLSRLMGRDESRVVTNIRGTRGYLAPEWLLEHGISEKSDVYSYGMVLLEMIGGRRNVCLVQNGNDRSQRKWQYFPKIANQKMKEGKIMEIVDDRLAGMGGIDEREVRRLLYVAFWCIQEKARLRPSMAEVVEMLEKCADVEEPPDTQMIVVDLLGIDDESPECRGLATTTKDAVATQQGDSSNTLPSTVSVTSFDMSVLSAR